MKRQFACIFVFLLLGAIVNVAVAWTQPYAFGEKRQIGWGNGTSTYEWELYPDRGWPIKSLSTEDAAPGSTYFLKGDFDLPFSPIWPGFAINTVFYAGMLWLLFAAPFALRRRLRIKRGLCPKCAYDLRGAPTDATACPECGAAVNRIRR